MASRADLGRRVRMWLVVHADLARATGPWSRRPHPGQRFTHGWRPTALGRALEAARAMSDKELVESWHDPIIDDPDQTKYTEDQITAMAEEIGRRAGSGDQLKAWEETEKRILRNQQRRESERAKRAKAIEDRIDQLIEEGRSAEDAYETVTGKSLARERAWDLIGRRAGESYEDALKRSYFEAVQEQLRDSESTVIDYFLSPYGERRLAQLQAEAARRGKSYFFSPAMLFSMPEAQAMKWASDELKDWWESQGGRLTFEAWRHRVER